MAVTDSTPLSNRVKDLTNRRVGRLLVIAFHDIKRFPSGHTYARWACLCDCGNTTIVTAPNLRAGHIKSCGCLKHDSPLYKTHGMSKTKLYQTWGDMIKRCENHNSIGFKNYGERGIKVCQRWRVSFEAFLADVGLPPSPQHTIERIDVNGNYEPGNVCWATRTEQMRNTRRNKRYEYKGQSLTLREWSEHTGIPYYTLQSRMYIGWSIEEALTSRKFMKRKAKLYTFNDQSLTLKEWSSILHISPELLAWRLNHHWSIEKAFTTRPVLKKLSPSSP